MVPGRDGPEVWPDGRVVGTPPPPATPGDPRDPRDINIGANMDRTIQYFQDGTNYGSYDPIFPGYEEVEKMRFPIFPGYEEVEKLRFPIFPGL